MGYKGKKPSGFVPLGLQTFSLSEQTVPQSTFLALYFPCYLQANRYAEAVNEGSTPSKF